MKRIKVSSSNLSSMGYDPKAKVLEVEFVGGAVYQYTGVPPEIHQALVEIQGKGGSIGSMFSTAVKGKYPFNQISAGKKKDAPPSTKSAGSVKADPKPPGRKRRKAPTKGV